MINNLFSNEAPIYKQIKEIIKSRISEGVYPINMLIPSEKELTKEFNVSRVTIRNALELLQKEGYINRKAGYGTYVCFSDPKLNKFTYLKSFTSEMREKGVKSLTLKSELKIIEANEQVAKLFSCPKGTKIQLLRRLRGNENSPIVLSETLLLLDEELPKTDDFLYGSLYSYLIRKGISFANMKETISSIIPSESIMNELLIMENQPVLKRVRYSYDKNNKLIEYTENYYNAERYSYTIEINSVNT